MIVFERFKRENIEKLWVVFQITECKNTFFLPKAIILDRPKASNPNKIIDRCLGKDEYQKVSPSQTA
jgi:hypothetical protein